MTTYKDILVLVDKVTKPLQDITQQMKKTSENGEKLKNKISRVNQTMAKMQPVLNRAWGGVMRLTRAFIGLVGSGGILTMGIAKVTDFADHIDKMSQKIGMSTDEYQKWNYIMSINGGNIDSLGMGFKTLTTQIVSANKGNKEAVANFKRLGIRLKDTKGNLRSTEDVFTDVVSGLQNMTNSTEKAYIGQKLFGRSFLEMKPLLNQNADAMAKLVKQFEKYGMKLSKKEIQNAVEFKDTWTTFTMFLQAQTNKALTNLLPKLQEILNKIMAHKEAIMRVIQALGELTVKVFKIVDYLAQHKVLLSSILSIIVALGAVTLYANIVTGLTAMTTAMAALGVTSNIALGGIPAILGLISGAITMVAVNWGHNIENMKNALKGLLKVLGFVVDLLGLNFGKIGKSIAGEYSKSVNNRNNVRQSQTFNNTSTTTTNNNYFGNTNTYSGMFGMSGAIYTPAR